MNNEQYLLNKLSEEANEIAMAASKAMQFGLDSDNNGNLPKTNRQSLFLEINDLLATVEMLNEECNFGYAPDSKSILDKKAKVHKYREISRNLGFVI